MYTKDQIIDKFNAHIQKKEDFEAFIAPKLETLSKAIKELQMAGIDVEIEMKQQPSLQAFEMIKMFHSNGARFSHSGSIIIGQVRHIFAISNELNFENVGYKKRNILFLHNYDSGTDYPIGKRDKKDDHRIFDLEKDDWAKELQDYIIASYARLYKINQNDPHNAFSYNKNSLKPAPQKLPLPLHIKKKGQTGG